MSTTWHGDSPPPRHEPPGVLGWLRVALRGTLLTVLVFGGLLVLLAVRLVERPLCGLERPITPFITVFVCRNALRILGLRLHVQGRMMAQAGAVVSKSEVAGWPGIGWLARATGTVFIERDRAKAREQAELFRERLGAGHRLLFFPEGTSSDGLRVLPFKSTLFDAFFAEELRARMIVQPVSVHYLAPADADPRFYGWWGDMGFGEHLLAVLAARRRGAVAISYHPVLRVADYADRKALARAAEKAVRMGFSDSVAGTV